MRQNVIQFGVLAGALFYGSSVWSDQVYKCKNGDGPFLYQKTPCPADAETVTSWTPKVKAGESSTEPVESDQQLTTLALKQQQSGHYVVDGAVNGKTLLFVVDTGASVVSLPSEDATAAGLACKNAAMMETANGFTEACTVTIPELRFGQFLVKDAEGMIVPNLKQPLLGMNVLKHFKIAQDNGEMRISHSGAEPAPE